MKNIIRFVGILSRLLIGLILLYWGFLVIPKVFSEVNLSVYYLVGDFAPLLFQNPPIFSITGIIFALLVIITSKKNLGIIIFGIAGLFFSLVQFPVTHIGCRPRDVSMMGSMDKHVLLIRSLSAMDNLFPSPSELEQSLDSNYLSKTESGDYLLFTPYENFHPNTCDQSLYKGQGNNPCYFMYQPSADKSSYTIISKSPGYVSKIYKIVGQIKDSSFTVLFCDANTINDCIEKTEFTLDPVSSYYCRMPPLE